MLRAPKKRHIYFACPEGHGRLAAFLVIFPGCEAQLWRCRTCRGEFMRGEEVFRVLQRARNAQFDPALSAQAGRNTRLCPECGAALTGAAASGVTLDRCPACNGLWLDRFEYENLLHSSPDWVSVQFGRHSLEDAAEARWEPKDPIKVAKRKGFAWGYVFGLLSRGVPRLWWLR